jgi:hypothetical protein
MQRLCRTAAGIKGYLADPGCLVNEQSRKCPFCAQVHRLWLYGWYWRWVVLPDPEPPQKIAVRRLYCPHARRTVSLLPDFCIPRRQAGPAVLALFLAIYLAGGGLLNALRKVRADARCHSMAQSLLRGFLKRAHALRAYLAGRRHRAVGPPPSVHPDRWLAAELFFGLVHSWPSAPAAFVFHGRCLHQRLNETLA